jgi:hypothetical protein
MQKHSGSKCKLAALRLDVTLRKHGSGAASASEVKTIFHLTQLSAACIAQFA